MANCIFIGENDKSTTKIVRWQTSCVRVHVRTSSFFFQLGDYVRQHIDYRREVRSASLIFVFILECFMF